MPSTRLTSPTLRELEVAAAFSVAVAVSARAVALVSETPASAAQTDAHSKECRSCEAGALNTWSNPLADFLAAQSLARRANKDAAVITFPVKGATLGL